DTVVEMRILKPLYRTLLSTKELSLPLLLNLAKHLPPPDSNLYRRSGKTTVDLFFFMIDALRKNSAPLELQKEYVGRAVRCYARHNVTQFFIAKHAQALDSIQALLNQDCIKNNKELDTAGKTARSELLQFEEEYKLE